MRDELEVRALEYYADQVRNGSDELYFYYRFFEKHFSIRRLPDGKELLRKAAMRIFTSDPFAYAATFPFGIEDLTEAELQQVAEAMTFGGDAAAASFLRGKLWVDAAHRSHSPRLFELAVAELEAVPEAMRNKRYWAALAQCYRTLDYEKFKPLIGTLLASEEPEWRSHTLRNVLEDVGRREDWTTYDLWRPQWDALPDNAHFCECQKNAVATLDGLRKLEDGDVAAATELLRRSTEVRGCPHLNTGCASVKLAQALADRGIVGPCREYLDFFERFGTSKEAAALRKQLDARP